MGEIVIRDLTIKDEYFVGTCSHIYESNEHDRCAEKRIKFIRNKFGEGLRVKVAFFDGRYAGFIHVLPIEISPFGPIGRDLMVIPCLYVQPTFRKRGVGKRLIKEAFKESIKQDKSGVTVVAYSSSLWLMPVDFFKKVGFEVLDIKKVEFSEGKYPFHEKILLWKVYEKDAEKPDFLEPNYSFKRVEGKIVVDVFYTNFCEISLINLERVKKVIKEFSSSVVLNIYCSDDREIFTKYQIPQGVFVNGKKICSFCELGEYEMRKIIVEELKRIRKCV